MTTIPTTLGEREIHSLGVTLPHEHLFTNLVTDSTAILLHDEAAVTQELEQFRAAGGGAIVDVTPAEIAEGAFGRLDDLEESATASHTRTEANVRSIVRVSEHAGVPVILSTGHYRDPYLDEAWFDRHSHERIGELMARDLEEGFPGTSVRAGVIGEIGSNRWYISAREERSFRAAAYAHRQTGAVVTTHASGWPTGPKQLELLVSEGVDPSRVIIGHCDTVPDPEYALLLARRGAYVQFDTFFRCRGGGRLNTAQLDRRAQLIRDLVDGGHAEQLLLSQDVCVSDHLAAAGGVGYAFLLGEGGDYLVEAGVEREVLDMALTRNVWAALAG